MHYDGKELELIGISSNTDPEKMNDAIKSRKKIVYTLALKHKRILVPVTVQSFYTDEEIKNAIAEQLIIYDVEL